MPLGPDDLVLCAGTLEKTPLLERIEIASRTGYRGISLFLDDLAQVREAGVADAELRDRLSDHGLSVAELDPLLSWVPGVEPGGAGFARWGEPDFHDAAAAVGARSINAVLFAPGPFSEEQLVDAFAALCERAAEHELLVHLEFMPFSRVERLETALAIVEKAAAPNGGILLDVWHHFRSGGTPEALERAAPRVLAIQLDDAPAEAEPNLIDETLHRRLLPGEGDAEVATILRVLRAGGCTAPPGVEVFSDALAAQGAEAFAQRCAEATRRVLDEARRAR